jgi:hypothetical protein
LPIAGGAGSGFPHPKLNNAVMILIHASHRRTAANLLAALIYLVAGVSGMSAQAQGRLKAHYTISMTGVPIGQIVWAVAIDDKRYTTSASGKASGVLSVLVNGEGSVVTRGMVVDGKLAPQDFTSNITDDDGNNELRMNFEGGDVKDLIGRELPQAGRLPVTEADRRGVADPLTAMLMPAGDDPFASANCKRVLPIFDGRRRYNLVLSFGRIDKVTIEHGYSGIVLVCGVVLRPIAGYRADSMLVKYVGGRRDMELWFAPIAGTSIVAPIRVLMPTLIGTLEIRADQFAMTISSPAPSASPR